MAVFKSKPTSAGRRHQVKVVTEGLHKGKPHGPLLEKKSKTGGRNNLGRITTRHIGGGHKQHYRKIDFKRTKDGIPAKVERIEYDPNRTAHIALLLYADGERRYIIAPKGVQAGDVLHSGSTAPIKAGNCLPVRSIPVGSVIHAIELKPGKGAQMARSAGASVSWLLVKVNTPLFACVPVRCAKYPLIAARRWARCPIRSTACASSVKLERRAGEACDPPCVAWQ